MHRKILIIITAFLALAILFVGFFLVDFLAPRDYALVMQNCGGDSGFAFAGSHISWHSTIEEAKQAGQRRLSEYNLASIYQPPAEGIFNPLLWMKTTNPVCYDGLYMEWSAIDQ